MVFTSFKFHVFQSLYFYEFQVQHVTKLEAERERERERERVKRVKSVRDLEKVQNTFQTLWYLQVSSSTCFKVCIFTSFKFNMLQS